MTMLKTQIRIYMGERNYKVTLDHNEIWIFRGNSDSNIDLVKTVNPVTSHEAFAEIVEDLEAHYNKHRGQLYNETISNMI